jgi:hypothetical protein
MCRKAGLKTTLSSIHIQKRFPQLFTPQDRSWWHFARLDLFAQCSVTKMPSFIIDFLALKGFSHMLLKKLFDSDDRHLGMCRVETREREREREMGGALNDKWLPYPAHQLRIG